MRSTSAATAPMDEEGSSSPYYHSTLRRKKNKGRIKHSQLRVDNNDYGDEQEHYQQQQLQEQDTEDKGGSGGLLLAINDNERLSHHGGCYRQDDYDCCASLESTAINNSATTTTTTTATTTKTKVLILLVVFLITGMIIQLYYDERSVIENNNSINNNNFHHRRDSSPSTSSSGSSNSNIAATASMASTTTTTTTSTLLTRTSQLSSLLANLDASDVIECYIVTRMANLANVASSSSSSSMSSMNSLLGGNKKYRRNVQGSDPDDDNIDTTGSTTTTTTSSSSIPTGPILIRKAALAFRYRPKVAHVAPSAAAEATTTTTTNPEKYFELTLEYGPQRAGASKTSESMPMVHIDMEIMSNYYDGGDDGGGISNSNNNNNNNNNNNIGKYVSWDNQGSIYYSTHISNEWSGAYYMSSITGVVLEKILEKVIEYPNKRPRYQPFEVVSLPSNNIILKSSGSDDFVWDMFRDMADLYVDIDPILVPPRGKVQFYVADPEEEEIEEENNIGGGEKKTMKQKRHLPNPNVKRVKGVIESSKAAAFYENFFNCASAKKTGDYSMYLPPLVTTSLAPSPVPPMIDDKVEDSNVPTTNTTADASNGLDIDDVDDGDSRRRLDEEVKVPSNSTNVDQLVDENKGVPKGVENSSKSSPNKSEDVVKTAEVVSGDDVDATKIDEGEEKISMSPQLDHDDDDDDYDKEIEITDPDAVEMTGPDEDHVASEDDGDAAKAAEKAAIEAAEKAEAAAAVAATNSSSPEDSAKAASEAAIAAKKAADATVAARAKSSAEGLLSGDGTLMTSILSSCFSDPKYGIRKMHANDGANDLTGSEQSTQIPSTYAYVYLDGDVFIRLNLTAPYWGTSSVLQTVPPPHAKVDGRGDVVDWAIFLLLMVATVFGFVVIVHQLGVVIDKRLQFRHVFHPLADDDSVEMERLEKGGGLPHSIGIDAIPVSLGGKLSHYASDKGHGPPTSYKDRLSDSSIGDERNGLLDIELATREKTMTVNSPKLASPNASDLPTSLRLKEEAPDLVERPTLKSMSKVALPHISPRNDQERVPRRRSFEIDTDMPRLPSIS